MRGFEFFGVGRIVFGRGRFAMAGELASQLGRAALVVYNGDEPGRGGALDRLLDQLKSNGVRATLVRQRGEPTVDDVDRAIAAAREANCDCVIGLGGGSAIDAAKAAAGLLANGGAALDYMEVVGKGQKITKPALPWMAIPTTAGTGAEATRNAVVGFPEKRFKASIRSELLLPRVALVDPELQVNVPPNVTAASGMDALCQLIESYTSTGANPFTDALAVHGIRLAAGSLRRVFANGSDLAAREDMAMAALLSGITLTSAGLGAVHGFAAPLGANFPVPHGVVCAALLPHVIAANAAALPGGAVHPTLVRYADVGLALAGKHGGDGPEAVELAVSESAALARDLRIPPLSSFGLTRERIPEMVALARKASSMRFNPVMLSDEALAGILERALDGVVQFLGMTYRTALLIGFISPLLLAGDVPAPRDGRELVGTKMPALQFDRWIGTDGGKPLDVSGRPVLYRWWTTGCPFCAKTLPAIETLRTRHESQGLRVVGVFHPKPPREVPAEKIQESAKRIGFNGVIAADDSWSQLKRVWLNEERPSTSVSILVDAKGVIRYVHPGMTFFPSDDPKHAKENAAFRPLEAEVAKVVAEPKEGRE